ncbi:MAG TPA: efflux transporter periplasmic adaptor subunit [Gammaproteobacteria bacterium]|nr:efflux transporter periplasmic adaptor subunit [Gammaproteobacteria bacterium]
MLQRFIIPISIILIGVAMVTTMALLKSEKKTYDKPAKLWRVTTAPIEVTSLSPEITIYGRVDTPRKATINAAITADVMQVDALEGQEVSKGQALLSLDNRDSRLLVAQRQADMDEVAAAIRSEKTRYQRDKETLINQMVLLDLAKKSVSRAQQLDQTRLVTRSTLDEAIGNEQRQIIIVKNLQHDIAEHPTRLAKLEASYQRAQALLSQAKLDLSRSIITAPFDSRIARLTVSAGDRVRAGDNLLSLYDLNSLEIRAQIPSRHLRSIRDSLRIGKPIIAQAQLDGQILPLQLTRLSGEAREDSGGVDGLFRLTDQQSLLTLGMFLKLTITLPLEHDVMGIPINALYGLNRVYVVEAGHLKAVKVEKIGEYRHQAQDYLIVRSEQLQQEKAVVITQLPNAISGLAVSVVNE